MVIGLYAACLVVGLVIYIHQSFFEKKSTSNNKTTLAGALVAFALAGMAHNYGLTAQVAQHLI